MKTIIKSTFLILAVLMSISDTTYSQERTITGKVTTYKVIPLNQVRVLVQSSQDVVFTDTLGNFTITCMKKDKIVLSAKGFKTKKVKLNNKTDMLSVNLVFLSNQDSKVVAVGYGHIKDENKLNAVISSQNNNNYSSYTDMYQLIRSKFPSVKVQGTEIYIRGTDSFNLSNSALIVIDGVATGSGMLQTLRPSEVKKISVLKNGSMYGSRGSNGVIIIETINGGNR